MLLRTRIRDAITNMPVSNHRIVILGESVYDISSIMHLCLDTDAHDPLTMKPLTIKEKELIRTKCRQLGMRPRRLPYEPNSNAGIDTNGEEFHIDTLLDAIQNDILWGRGASLTHIDILIRLLHTIKRRDNAQGQYMTYIVMEKLKCALASKYGNDNTEDPMMSYLESALQTNSDFVWNSTLATTETMQVSFDSF